MLKIFESQEDIEEKRRKNVVFRKASIAPRPYFIKVGQKAVLHRNMQSQVKPRGFRRMLKGLEYFKSRLTASKISEVPIYFLLRCWFSSSNSRQFLCMILRENGTNNEQMF